MGTRVHFYASTGTDTRLRVRLVWRDDATGATRIAGTTYMAPRSGAAWRAGPALAPPKMPVSRREFSSLRLRLTALDGGLDPAVSGATARVHAALARVTLQPCAPQPPDLAAGQWPAGCWRPYAASAPFNGRSRHSRRWCRTPRRSSPA